jgi:hypothetical protein
MECRNCPIYRGRHSYIVPKDGDETPQPRIVKKPDDWQARFREVVQNREEDLPQAERALQSKPQETTTDGGGKKRKKYRIRLTVLDRETGERRACTGSEASKWDWGDRQKVRSIGPWHIYSFERLLAILADKAESGCGEVELTEAPFYMGC